MRSIRANLVAWLSISLAVGGAAVLCITYTLTRHQVSSAFDDELKQVALAVHLREDWTEAGKLRIARPGFSLSVRAYDPSGHVYFETALPTLPEDLPQTNSEGFAQIDTAEGPWRIYTHVAPEGTVQVGQPVEARDALARNLSLKVLTPLLMLIPVLALLAGWFLKRALAPLDETSRRVADRDATRLDPLPSNGVPAELAPLVSQINALMARLGASLDSRRRFLADAAHELRSPVAALALQVQIAKRADGRHSRAAMEELEHGVERARRLVQQLLDYARLEPGVLPPPHDAVDLAMLAREVVGGFAARADQSGIDLGAETARAAWVRGSEQELRALIENLVDNALRYAPPESAVTVGVRGSPSTVELRVEDRGPGIPESEREAVFERFHRVPGDATPGTGLGLAIVKSIVERHDGRLTLADADAGAPRRGLVVRVELRAAPQPAFAKRAA